MQNFHEYLKSIEALEEKTGLDTDKDGEKGEPAAHQKKVKAAKQETLKFFIKRKDGAAKIAAQAASKGGPAQLTAWHFSAKAKPYREVLQAIKTNKDQKFFNAKYKEHARKIAKGGLTQKQFQEVTGRLEVWGEACAKLFK